MIALETPSEAAELYSKMAALRRSNEALENARRRDQQLIVQLRSEIAKKEWELERSEMAYQICFSCLKQCK